MATARTRVVRDAQARASGRSTSRTGRRPAAKPPSNTPIIMGLAAGGLALVIILVMMTFGGDGTKAGTNENNGSAAKSQQPAKPQQPKSTPAETTSRSPSSYAARPGKTPKRPAPPIPASVFVRTEDLFVQAKAKWNEGQRARKSNDSSTYTTAIKEAYAAIQSINETLDPYSSWYEEADLEGWAMPGEYVALSKKFNKYDKLAAMVQKVKTQ